jgi:CHASE2 domain-containing sensor protein
LTTKKTEAAKKHNRKLEYFLINIFSFICIGLIALFLLNFSLFDPFKLAFKDFSLTDVYYTSMINKNQIYNGPLVIVNIENKTRAELAFLLEKLQEGRPKVIGVDIIFPDRKDSSDALLKAVFSSYSNFVLPYSAQFDASDSEVHTNNYFDVQHSAFVNLIGEHKEFSTIRSYYPVYNNQPAFTTAIIQKYNASLAEPLLKKDNHKKEIRYFGNLENFHFYTFDEIIDPEFLSERVTNKIVLVGSLGSIINSADNYPGEDHFYTPLNQRSSGRSYPDMYGLIVHANILRMVLDKDFIRNVPWWLNWTIAFLFTWALIPLFSRWYIHRAMWSHLWTMFAQLFLSILFVYLIILLFANGNLKIEAASILVAVLLLGDIILFYDAFVKFFKLKLKWNFHSIFFEGH